ncbi:MAG: glycosyltransferase family 2 protein [Actinomycetota bacterium]|nr:glycosyltransferase family 2 protein [Actinomycetota bacterium]
MSLVAIVLAWNGREDTLACLESLREIDTICVDNGSSDGTGEAVRKRFPAVELLRSDENLGYAGGNNLGIRRALARGADWILLLNNDTVADAGIAGALEAAAGARPDAGVLACKVLFADAPERLMYAGGRFDTLLGYSGRLQGHGQPDDGRFDTLREVDRATGEAMAVSRAAIELVGPLDESLFAYVEDVEWCLRIRAAGCAVLFVPEARVWHRGSASTGGTRSTANLYYSARNTLAVVERHRPLPRGLRGLRRGVVVGTHLAQALAHPRRRAALRAVREGWRDYRAGRLGPKAAT